MRDDALAKMPRHQRTGPTIAKSSRSEKPPVTATPNPGYFRHLEINGYQYYARPQQKSVAKPTNAKPAGNADSSKVKIETEPKEKKLGKIETEPKEKPRKAMPPEATMRTSPAGEDGDDEVRIAGTYRRDQWYTCTSITDTAVVLEE